MKQRKYEHELELIKEGIGDLFTVEEWKEAVESGDFNMFDGVGYWVKDEKESDDEVFSTPQLDATHVVWYNK